METIALSVKYRQAVECAEAEARTMMEAAGFSSLFAFDGGSNWDDAFGVGRDELRELQTMLARRYHKLHFWQREKREAIVQSYIKVHAMLTVAHGCQSIWR